MVASLPWPAFVGAVVAAFAAALAWYGFRECRLAYLVLRSNPNDVLEATDGGPIELEGVARPVGDVVRSPFTDTPALVYEYEVEERHETQHGSSWQTIDSGERFVPFLLEDDTGAVLIEPPGASFRLEAETIEVKGGTAPPEQIQRFIDETEAVDDQNTSVDLRVLELRTGDDRRFVERRLEPGEGVYVIGTARYDTSVSRLSGQVNAAVGIDEAALSASRWIRLRHRLLGTPFVVSDRDPRSLGLRAGAAGVGALVAAVLAIGFAAFLLA